MASLCSFALWCALELSPATAIHINEKLATGQIVLLAVSNHPVVATWHDPRTGAASVLRGNGTVVILRRNKVKTYMVGLNSVVSGAFSKAGSVVVADGVDKQRQHKLVAVDLARGRRIVEVPAATLTTGSVDEMRLIDVAWDDNTCQMRVLITEHKKVGKQETADWTICSVGRGKTTRATIAKGLERYKYLGKVCASQNAAILTEVFLGRVYYCKVSKKRKLVFAERRREQLIGCAHLNRTNAIVLVNSKTRSEAVIVNLATRREVCGFVLHYAADRTPWTPRQGWTKVWLTQLSHTSGHVDIDLLDALDESVKRVANLENRGDFRQWLMLELLDLDSTAVSALVTFRYFIWEVSVIVKLRKLEPDPR